MSLLAVWLLLAVEATCVPINSDMYWVTLPNGKSDSFVRTAKDPQMLAGAYPWFGVVRPEMNMVNIATQSDYKGRACEYGYVGGRLRFVSEGGKDREIDPKSYSRPRGDIRGFWPTKALYEELLKKNDIWKGGGRLRFISRNPNRTALFVAQLALVAFGFLLFSKAVIWRIHAALWSLIFLVLEFQTVSRGGILALLAGTAVLVWFRFARHLTLKTFALLSLGGLLLVGTCFLVYRNRMMEETSHDGSQSRTAIWREVPRMIAAAPLGWGLWQSGPAYNSWFEKPERHHMIGDLFNDHLSRFVEGGFVLGGAYVFLWFFVCCAAWRWASKGHSSIVLAIWIAYFVASSFNPMNYWERSFWIPGGVMAAWLVQIFRTKDGWRIFRPLLPLGLTVCVLAALGVVAACAPEQDVPIRVSALGRQVRVGKGEPSVWVVDDGFVLDGNFNGYPGRELRQFYAAHPNAEALGVVERVEHLPRAVDRLILTGLRGEDYLAMKDPPKARQIAFLTPPFDSTKIPEALRKSCDVHFIMGEFLAMRTGDDLRKENWIHVIPGAQVYIPHWLDMMVKEHADET